MTLLRTKDNTDIKKEELELIPRLREKLVGKTLADLTAEGVFVFPDTLKNSEDLSSDQFVLEKNGDFYRTGNVMGFLGLDDERLIICSRFGGEEDHFFLYLLAKVFDFPNIVDLKTSADDSDRLFDFLLFLFPLYLKSALRKGLFKKYIRRSYNDANIKGTIDLPRHIRQNTPFIGKVAYDRRELSADNSLLQLVRHTIEYIKGRPCGRSLLARAKDETELIAAATPSYKFGERSKVVFENKKAPVRHAYFREYRDLQRLCLAILRQQKQRIGGGPRPIYGILFDGAWLWEEYIASLLKKFFHHPKNKASENAQYLFAKSKGKIYPDFIGKLDEKNRDRLIADAKYKPAGNIVGGDYLQMLAYMFRFDAKCGYFLYPEDQNESGDEVLYLNSGSTYEKNVRARDDITVTKHGLIIPREEDPYAAFAEKMKNAERIFLSLFDRELKTQ